MEQIILFQPSEFWEKHQQITRQILKEELSNLPNQQIQEDLIVLEEACAILHKSKQTIYNWMDEGRLNGYSFEGLKIDDPKELSKKDRESLYFLRSEIYKGLKIRDKNNKK